MAITSLAHHSPIVIAITPVGTSTAITPVGTSTAITPVGTSTLIVASATTAAPGTPRCPRALSGATLGTRRTRPTTWSKTLAPTTRTLVARTTPTAPIWRWAGIASAAVAGSTRPAVRRTATLAPMTRVGVATSAT